MSATQSGGGFRAQTFQDLLGSIIANQNQNGLTASTGAQQAVLNSIVAWNDTIALSDSTTLTNGAATAWGNFTFNNAVWR